MQERIRIGARGEPRVCPYCTDALEGVLAYCGGCGARYHSACWNELRGCAVQGCRMRAEPPRQGRDPSPVRPAPAPAPAPARTSRRGVHPAARYGVSAHVPARSELSAAWLLRAAVVVAAAAHALVSVAALAWAAGVASHLLAAHVSLLGHAAFMSYVFLQLHAVLRFEIPRHDWRLIFPWCGFLIPFSGALYWLLWGREL